MAVLWQNLPALGPGPRRHILKKKNVQVLHQQNLNSIYEPLGPEQAQTQGLGYLRQDPHHLRWSQQQLSQISSSHHLFLNQGVGTIITSSLSDLPGRWCLPRRTFWTAPYRIMIIFYTTSHYMRITRFLLFYVLKLCEAYRLCSSL